MPREVFRPQLYTVDSWLAEIYDILSKYEDKHYFDNDWLKEPTWEHGLDVLWESEEFSPEQALEYWRDYDPLDTYDG